MGQSISLQFIPALKVYRSRAMAVASLGGRVYLYRLKSMEVLSEEVEEGSNLNPLKEVSTISGHLRFSQV